MVDYVKKVVKGSLLLLFMSALGSLFTYFFRIYLARELTVEEYGLIFAVISLLLFVNVFRVMGVSDASTKYLAGFVAKRTF